MCLTCKQPQRCAGPSFSNPRIVTGASPAASRPPLNVRPKPVESRTSSTQNGPEAWGSFEAQCALTCVTCGGTVHVPKVSDGRCWSKDMCVHTLPGLRHVAFIRRARYYLAPVFQESGIRQTTVSDLYVCRIQLATSWGMKGVRLKFHVNYQSPVPCVAILASCHCRASSLQIAHLLTSLLTLRLNVLIRPS